MLPAGRAATVSNLIPRTDTAGQIVNAHDGQIVHENGTYYWFAAGYDACHESAGLATAVVNRLREGQLDHAGSADDCDSGCVSRVAARST